MTLGVREFFCGVPVKLGLFWREYICRLDNVINAYFDVACVFFF